VLVGPEIFGKTRGGAAELWPGNHDEGTGSTQIDRGRRELFEERKTSSPFADRARRGSRGELLARGGERGRPPHLSSLALGTPEETIHIYDDEVDSGKGFLLGKRDVFFAQNSGEGCRQRSGIWHLERSVYFDHLVESRQKRRRRGKKGNYVFLLRGGGPKDISEGRGAEDVVSKSVDLIRGKGPCPRELRQGERPLPSTSREDALLPTESWAWDLPFSDDSKRGKGGLGYRGRKELPSYSARRQGGPLQSRWELGKKAGGKDRLS